MLTEELLDAARSHEGAITALRRAIHAEPELGLDTPKTLAKVKEALADLPLEWREGPACTGAVAVLKGASAGRRVLLRGDMGGGISFGAVTEDLTVDLAVEQQMEEQQQQ